MTKEPKLEDVRRALRDEREKVADLKRYINELEENAAIDREQIDKLREERHYWQKLSEAWEEAREQLARSIAADHR